MIIQMVTESLFDDVNHLILQVPGLVNVDFADVRAIMENAGSSLMGIGTATGNSGNHFCVNISDGF